MELILRVIDTTMPEVKVVVVPRIGDVRGFLSEIWNVRDLSSIGVEATFVQENHVHSLIKGTLRGLHYQIPQAAQGKLVRVTRGAIFDVAVDIRRGSPRFGCHTSAVLSEDNWNQFWVPPGFAHGYCTLEDNTDVLYRVTDFYSSEHDRGIAWNDPELTIAWPVRGEPAVISERDRKLPRLADQPDLFTYPR